MFGIESRQNGRTNLDENMYINRNSIEAYIENKLRLKQSVLT